MAKIHILGLSDDGKARVVIHIPMIKGENKAGKTWESCWLSEESRDSALKVGNEPGNITQYEKDLIDEGKMIEVVENILIESGGGTDSSLNEMVNRIITEFKQRLQTRLRFYGRKL